jgi:hypothetical protein
VIVAGFGAFDLSVATHGLWCFLRAQRGAAVAVDGIAVVASFSGFLFAVAAHWRRGVGGLSVLSDEDECKRNEHAGR